MMTIFCTRCFFLQKLQRLTIFTKDQKIFKTNLLRLVMKDITFRADNSIYILTIINNTRIERLKGNHVVNVVEIDAGS